MITDLEYLKAVYTVREYHKQIENEINPPFENIVKTSIDIIINDFTPKNEHAFNHTPIMSRLKKTLLSAKKDGFLYIEDLTIEKLKNYRNTGRKSIEMYNKWKLANNIL